MLWYGMVVQVGGTITNLCEFFQKPIKPERDGWTDGRMNTYII